MINASFSSPQRLSLLGCEDAAPAQAAAEVVARLAKQVRRANARAAQAVPGQGNTGHGSDPLNVHRPEEFGAIEVLLPLATLLARPVIRLTLVALVARKRLLTW